MIDAHETWETVLFILRAYCKLAVLLFSLGLNGLVELVTAEGGILQAALGVEVAHPRQPHYLLRRFIVGQGTIPI